MGFYSFQTASLIVFPMQGTVRRAHHRRFLSTLPNVSTSLLPASDLDPARHPMTGAVVFPSASH